MGEKRSLRIAALAEAPQRGAGARAAGLLARRLGQAENITFVEIDRDTGRLALPGCPRTYSEPFIAGTEPVEFCELHRW